MAGDKNSLSGKTVLKAATQPADTFEIDYSKFHPNFDNTPQKIGPEWSKLDDTRDQYIQENALNWKPQDVIPDSISGLDRIKIKKTPSTRNWHRRISSWERNGNFNVWTIKLNTKMKYLLFYPCLLWGMTSHVNTGWYKEKYDHSDDRDWRVYDKLSNRPLPFHRVWNRPG